MAKRLRFRFFRVIPSFHGFRSKDNGAASSPVNSDSGFDVDFPARPPHLSRRPQPPLVSAGCCCPSRRRSLPAKSALADVPPTPRETPAYIWRKEEKWWHVVPCASSVRDVKPPLLLLPSTEVRVRRRRRGLSPAGDAAAGSRRKVAIRRRPAWRRRPRGGSYSSADDDDDSGWSSNDEETETLVSAMDVDPSDNVLRRRRRRRKRVGCGGGRRGWPSPEGTAAVRRLILCSAPAVRESFAVVKLSDDPREDFRRSMAEMVVEKEIFDTQGLEQLLRCFLSLNSRQHHAAIVAAFEDIWKTIFPVVPTTTGAGSHCVIRCGKEKSCS